jgi:predicted O-methyltransferase YrrM
MLNHDRFDKIQGWLFTDEAHWLYEAVLVGQCRNMLEIGCYRGRSTYALLSGLQDVKTFRPKHLTSIDPYWSIDGFPYPESVKKETIDCFNEVVSLFPSGYHTLIQKFSLDAYPTLRPKSFDFGFIDGDHSLRAALLDIENCLKLLKPGSILCGHDYKPNEYGVKEAVDTLLPNHQLGAGSLWWYKLPAAH